MKILGVIPARYASTRFPGKPLAIIGGKTMIQRVYEQSVKASKVDAVVVATDDERIANEVDRFGGKYVMTKHDHASGTDRCAEALSLTPGDWDAVINIQGDEPFIAPDQIDLLASCFEDSSTQLATLVKPIGNIEELFNENIPKVTIANNGNALYFSRQVIPFLKNVVKADWLKHHVYFKHIGIYGYRADVLYQLTKLKQSKLEIAESLEQLRWLENGYHIYTKITEFETIAIDTPEDLQRAQLALN
jgi:3-deoxy-manno-octulosonate cytidylyltransferase (CMP-KDO synthetase)